VPNEVGMDADQVRAMATKLLHEAERLTTISGTIDRIVADLPRVWKGRDAATFEGWWRDKHKPALNHAQAAIAGLAHSAKNNATAQDHASGQSVSQSGVAPTLGAGIAAVGVAASHPTAALPAHTFGATNTLPTIKGKETELAGYRAAYASHASYLRGFDEGQCTSWAIYRRHEMGLPLPPMNGHNNGNEMAANLGLSPGNQPHPGSLVSYGSGDGHVMVVESVEAGGNTLHVSEMNFDYKGGLSVDSVLTRNPDGTWDKFLDGHLYKSDIAAQFSTA
jgi:surface antigen/uncharacterized protein YukE